MMWRIVKNEIWGSKIRKLMIYILAITAEIRKFASLKINNVYILLEISI